MGQQDLLTNRRIIRGQPHRVRALTISILFHVALIATLFALACLYHSPLVIMHNGSAAGAPVITLEPMVIAAPPALPTPPAPPAPPVPATASLPVKVTPLIVGAAPQQPPHPVESHPASPQPAAGVPVLAGPTAKPVVAPPAKTGTPAQKVATSSPVTGAGTGHLRPAGAKFVSSYAPGSSIFPHPPYPSEARDLQETGVVRMMIRFDTKGDVVRADVVQSSGVAILDSNTRAYIYANWHSQAFAGQAVSVPVEYTLTSL